MTEKELVSKIKTLRNIQPDKEWVMTTKARILGKEKFVLFPFHSWLKSRAFLIAPALAVLLLIGVFVYNTFDISIFQPFKSETAIDPKVLEAITTGLRTVELGVVKATADLGKVREPERVKDLGVTVSSTLENGEKIVAAVKKLPTKAKDEKTPEVLAAIGGVENALDEMERAYVEKQKDAVSQLIKDLENSILTEQQKELVEKAKSYYEQGNFSEALIKALEASQIR